MENNQLEKAIENLFMIEQCRFRDIDRNEIEAIGCEFNSDFSYFTLFHNPLIQQIKTYVALNPSIPKTYEKTILISDVVFSVIKNYDYKKDKNLLEKIKYLFKPVEDEDSVSYRLGYTFPDWQEKTFLQDELVIPVYHGNSDYELVKNEAMRQLLEDD